MDRFRYSVEQLSVKLGNELKKWHNLPQHLKFCLNLQLFLKYCNCSFLIIILSHYDFYYYLQVYPPSKVRNHLVSSAIQCENSLLETPFPNRPAPPFTSAIESKFFYKGVVRCYYLTLHLLKTCFTVICFFESSKSWPKEAGAIQRMKSAFCGAICNELRGLGIATHATAKHAYIFKVSWAQFVETMLVKLFVSLCKRFLG